ncbi:hypothetical protein MJD09_22515, partial [bacterium]|nr:hypothetical protein [bacterium]
ITNPIDAILMRGAYEKGVNLALSYVSPSLGEVTDINPCIAGCLFIPDDMGIWGGKLSGEAGLPTSYSYRKEFTGLAKAALTAW